ncbi:MAG: hypothetical protein QOJ65_2337 [Fimbriimonadaceae bacterium]|jgi:hypothetical protein|nr:hypothetical protein [Fimbriimonadaceae bacterium]
MHNEQFESGIDPGFSPGVQDKGYGKGQKDRCHDWTAIHDFMPPGPSRLRVDGVCDMPTPGYTIKLEKANPQGINPKILLLNKTEIAPGGIRPDVITPTPAHYEEETEFPYAQVNIQPDGTTIDVQDVH